MWCISFNFLNMFLSYLYWNSCPVRETDCFKFWKKIIINYLHPSTNLVGLHVQQSKGCKKKCFKCDLTFDGKNILTHAIRLCCCYRCWCCWCCFLYDYRLCFRVSNDVGIAVAVVVGDIAVVDDVSVFPMLLLLPMF